MAVEPNPESQPQPNEQDPSALLDALDDAAPIAELGDWRQVVEAWPAPPPIGSGPGSDYERHEARRRELLRTDARRYVEKRKEAKDARRLERAVFRSRPVERDEAEWVEADDPEDALAPLFTWVGPDLPEHIGPDCDPEEDMLCAVGSNLLVIANYKVGKTTQVFGMCYRLAGAPTPWLGVFATPQPLTVAYFDFELLASQHKRWRRRASDALGVRHDEDVQSRFRSLPLRSASAPNPATKAGRKALVRVWLAYQPDVAVLEPATAWVEGDGNSAEVVIAWTRGLDLAKGKYDRARMRAWQEAGAVGEPPPPLTCVISLHTPKSVKPGEETAIGSGRWMGWADEFIVLGKTEAGARSFSSGGRFIKVPETMLVGDNRWSQELDTDNLGRGRREYEKATGADEIDDLAAILTRKVAAGESITKVGIKDVLGVKRPTAESVFDRAVENGWLAPRRPNERGPLKLPVDGEEPDSTPMTTPEDTP